MKRSAFAHDRRNTRSEIKSDVLGSARRVFTASVIIVFLAALQPSALFAQGQPFYPNDPYFFYNAATRPSFPGQWHLENNTPKEISFTNPIQPEGPNWYKEQFEGKTNILKNSGVNTNIVNAWKMGYTGKGVVIGIVDDGVEGTHEDIAPNYIAALSRSFYKGTISENQGPVSKEDNHGTAVAGVAAARGGNGIGGTGAAPYAGVAGLRIPAGQKEDKAAMLLDALNAYTWKSGVDYKISGDSVVFTTTAAPEIHIKNHSYGDETPFEITELAKTKMVLQSLHETAANGVIHVYSAGNDRNTANEDANKVSINSHRDVINVAAMGSDGKFSDYSSYGASVFVTALSGSSNTLLSITTTDRTGKDLGYNAYSSKNRCGENLDKCGELFESFPDYNYTSGFSGTSSSAPLVAGILALGREANPEMDVRMAKHVLVRTSDKVDAGDASSTGGWLKNGAGNWFNPNYGFGNINAGKLVETVKNVAYVTDQTSYSTGLKTVNKPIQYINGEGVGGTSASIALTKNELTDSIRQPLEGVEILLNFTHPKRGDVAALLKSPSGMMSVFLNPTSHLEAGKQDTASVTNFEWTFLSNAFWGESGLGTWTITMGDTVNGKSGTVWNSYNLTLLMGDIVMKDNLPSTQNHDIKARSLTLSNPDASYTIPAGLIFQARDGINVNGGSLVVNGGVTEDAGGYGSLVEITGGALSGTGSITAKRGVYNKGGIIKPGNSIGTLTVNGNYYQNSQGKLLIEVATPAGNDLLVVNGAASLNGALQTAWTGGYVPLPKTKFGTILTASSGVAGGFSSLLTNITPTVLFKPKYDIPNQVYLVVERDYMNQGLFPYLSQNQRAAASMLNSVGNDATGDLNSVLKALDALPAYNQAAYAIDQLVPKGGEAQSSIGISGASFQTGNLSERLSDLRQGIRGISLNGLYFKEGRGAPVMLAGINPDLTGMLPTGVNEKWGVFAKGNAVYGDQKDKPDMTGYDFTAMGVTIGSDYRFTQECIAGLMLGLNTARANVDTMGSKVKMDGYTFGAYGTYYKKDLYVDASVSYGLADYDNTRRIVFPGIDRTASSSPDGNQFTAYAATGYDIRKNNWMITPSISMQYINLNVDSYTESGAGALNLNVDRQNTESLQGNIGARAHYIWQTNFATVMPNVRASYGYEFLRNSRNITSRLAQGSSPFSIETISPDRSFLTLGGGITALTAKGAAFYVTYDAQIGENSYIAHSVNTGVRVKF